jgi:hypothetical protein
VGGTGGRHGRDRTSLQEGICPPREHGFKEPQIYIAAYQARIDAKIGKIRAAFEKRVAQIQTALRLIALGFYRRWSVTGGKGPHPPFVVEWLKREVQRPDVLAWKQKEAQVQPLPQAAD